MGNQVCGKSQKSLKIISVLKNEDNGKRIKYNSKKKEIERDQKLVDMKFKNTNKKQMSKNKIIEPKKREITSCNIENVLNTFSKKSIIILSEGFKILEVKSNQNKKMEMFVLTKSNYNLSFFSILRLVDSVNLNFPGCFVSDFEVFQDKTHFYVICANYKRLVEEKIKMNSEVVYLLINTLRKAAICDKENILAFFVNPLNYILENDELKINQFYAMFEWENKKNSFGEVLFYPPEFISKNELNENSFYFIQANIDLFFDEDIIYYDYRNFEEFLPNSKFDLNNFIPKNSKNIEYYLNSLKNNPSERKFTNKHQKSSEINLGKLNIILFLHYFALFCSEFSYLNSKFIRLNSQLKNDFFILDENLHYLTVEGLLRGHLENDKSELFENHKMEFSKIHKKTEDQKKETLNINELANFWLKEKQLSALKKFKTIISGKINFIPEIDLFSYLKNIKTLEKEEANELVENFKSLF